MVTLALKELQDMREDLETLVYLECREQSVFPVFPVLLEHNCTPRKSTKALAKEAKGH